MEPPKSQNSFTNLGSYIQSFHRSNLTVVEAEGWGPLKRLCERRSVAVVWFKGHDLDMSGPRGTSGRQFVLCLMARALYAADVG